MRIAPIGNQNYFNFRGETTGATTETVSEAGSKAGSKFGNILEGMAATIKTKTNTNRKSISIELHNSLVKLTAYRVAIFFAALSGFLGFKASDIKSDNATKDMANTVQVADIDTEASVEIADINHDGTTDLVLKKKDGSKLVLDLKNSNVLTESNGLKKVD